MRRLLVASLASLLAVPLAARCARAHEDDDDAAPSAAIVYLDDNGKSCPLVRFDPTARGDDRLRELASFPGPCRGALVALGPERRAAVLFDPEVVDRRPRLPGLKAPRFDEEPVRKGAARLYEARKGRVRALPDLPAEFGVARDLGYLESTLCAIAVEDPAGQKTQAEAEHVYVVKDARLIAVDEGPGAPTVAHALCLEGEAWVRRETMGTRTGAPRAAEVTHLETYEGLDADRSARRLSPSPKGAPIDDAALLGRLKAQTPRAKDLPAGAGWIELDGTTARVAIFRLGAVGPAVGRVVVLGAKGPPFQLPGLGHGEGDTVSATGNGPFVLVATPITGTHPRLYDARRRRLLFTSDQARAAMFAPPE